jgi:DNA-binding ferritin-like protein (Dps family)
MARITWEFQQVTGQWFGKVGARVAFVAKPSPSNKDWTLIFNWINVTYEGFPTVGSTRDPAERKLVIFAEQTGLILPENVEEDGTLAEELMHRIQGEMRWFKDGDTDRERAHCVAVQVLDFFADWVKEHRKLVDSVGDDIEYRAAQSKLAEMEELLLSAQEDLGVEVEREVQ